MRYQFEDDVLDTGRRELRRKGTLVSVAPQVFNLLAYLIKNRDRIVSKDELIIAVWGGRIISEAALTTRLHIARTVIGDRGREQRLIKTLPRSGFRFVGTVQEEPADTGAPRAIRMPIGRRLVATPAHLPSIAVLPFRLLSGEEVPASISQRLTEDVSIGLAKCRWFRVLSGSRSVFDYEVGCNPGRLGGGSEISYVLHGSVQRVGNRVRVTGQLIDAATGMTIWGDRCDRSRLESFAAYDTISDSMIRAVAAAIGAAEQKRALQKPTEDHGAWEAFQLGLWHLAMCDAAANKVARGQLQHAIDLDPNFAPAYAALGFAFMTASSIFSEMTIAEGCCHSEPLIRMAIALDENNEEARSRLALNYFLKGDIDGALQDAEGILAVNPSSADAFGIKGAALVYSGRQKEGRGAIQQYLKLSPRDIARPVRLTQMAASLYLDGGYENAASAARQVIREYPQVPIAYRWLAASLGQLGRSAEAAEALRSLQSISPTAFDMYVRQRPPQYCNAEYAHMLRGLRKAGWSE